MVYGTKKLIFNIFLYLITMNKLTKTYYIIALAGSDLEDIESEVEDGGRGLNWADSLESALETKKVLERGRSKTYQIIKYDASFEKIEL